MLEPHLTGILVADVHSRYELFLCVVVCSIALQGMAGAAGWVLTLEGPA